MTEFEITSPDEARKWMRLASRRTACNAWLDGYAGVDCSMYHLNKSEREYYDTWWLRGAYFKESETNAQRQTQEDQEVHGPHEL